MDNARWIVVLSVILSMMVTLTLLKRYAGGPRLETPTTVENVAQTESARPAEQNRSVISLPSRREIPRFGQVSFPKPAVHTFSVDQPRDFDKMNESIKNEGALIR